MEKLYRKKENGKYECVGYDYDNLSDGIWLVQTNPHSKSMTNLMWRVGDIKKPVDLVTHASLQTMEHKISIYLSQLTQESSPEFKELKKMYGDWVRGPLQINNLSFCDLTSIILRQIAIQIEEK